MRRYVKRRGVSVSTVVLVLVVVALLQGAISWTTTFGDLGSLVPAWRGEMAAVVWLLVRAVAILVTIGLWIGDRKPWLGRFIILTNLILTVGLATNLLALMSVLAGSSSQDVDALLTDVVLVAGTNVLIFSIWYWIIDPPGIDDDSRSDRPWELLFPQRAKVIPRYEEWRPRYTDYLYLAFTDSFAFSPTDTMPLTRRTKLLMLLQALISIVTLTGLAASAINLLAGANSG
jgi:hypothetical protein